MGKNIFFLLFLTASSFLLTTNVVALEFQSPRFKLEIDNLNIDVAESKPVIYTISSLQGERALKQFKAKGFAVNIPKSEEDLILSLSQSIINFDDVSPGRTLTEGINLSVLTSKEQDFHVTMIQEYPLKNLSGETMDLNFSLDDSYFRPLPNQNSGDFPTLVLTKKGKGRIFFKINPPLNQSEGTYETIVQFVAIPNY